ncbi:MAG: hypothetical protein ABL963_00725 [Longimicrobiales bacterium]
MRGPRAGGAVGWMGRCAWIAQLALLIPATVYAQGYRGWTSTSVQVVELRPIGLDSVPRTDVVTDAQGRFLYQGSEVSCVLVSICTGYFARDDESTIAATQDLGITLWGFGMEGLSFTAHVRGRARGGGGTVWPRSDDEFDALLGYAQLERGRVRLRAGRMEARSGLGFSGFDGASAAYSAGTARVEVYGGLSLARGLREPQNEALRGLDGFLLDQSVLIVGGSAAARPWDTQMTARYQREILRDRSSLVSERVSVDVARSFPRSRLHGSIDYDLAFQRWGKGQVTLSVPLQEGRWLAEATALRYLPYFDLSTLWGIFEPVSYSEVMGRLGWSPDGRLGAWISAGRRSYGDTETTVILRPMRDTGWRVDAGARWRAAEAWILNGSYVLEWGPGGFLSSADASLHFEVTDRLSATATALTFQQIEEYRLGEGRAFGGGASAEYAFGERAFLSAGFSLIRHRDGGNVFTSPWNQGRAWTSLRFDLGRDPGLSARGGGA